MIGKATFHTKTLQDAIAKNRERLHEAAQGLPVREWKPYHEPEALRRNIERCKERTAWPSRYA